MKALANEIYNILLDMDFIDYSETVEKEIETLTEDLELLKDKGNGSLLNAIKMMMEK